MKPASKALVLSRRLSAPTTEEKAEASKLAGTRPGAFFVPKKKGRVDFVALVRGDQEFPCGKFSESPKNESSIISNQHDSITETCDMDALATGKQLRENSLAIQPGAPRMKDETGGPNIGWNEDHYDLSNLCLNDIEDKDDEVRATQRNRQVSKRRSEPSLYPTEDSETVLKLQEQSSISYHQTQGKPPEQKFRQEKKHEKKQRRHIKNQNFFLELSPGVNVTLRGSVESRRALRKGEVALVQCMECLAEPYCMDDAEYVLCPQCKCVSPNLNTPTRSKVRFGVGLGFLSYSEQDLLYDTEENSSLSSDSESSI